MNSSGVSSLMAGIAELHNWSLQSEIIDKNTVLTLNYSRPPIPRDVYGLGDCIIETLPTDIRNWLFRSRSIVETNLKITAPKGSSLGSNKYLEISAERSRLRRYRQSVENQVRTTFKTLEIGPQKRVGNLPVPLRKLVYNWQLIISAAKLFDDLWDSKNIDVSYFRHPEQSFLIEENGFLGIKGPDGKSFGVRMGPH